MDGVWDNKKEVSKLAFSQGKKALKVLKMIPKQTAAKQAQKTTPKMLLSHCAASARDRRRCLILTQAELAQRAGVSLGLIKRFEKGGGISLGAFVRIVIALGREIPLQLLLPSECVVASVGYLKNGGPVAKLLAKFKDSPVKPVFKFEKRLGDGEQNPWNCTCTIVMPNGEKKVCQSARESKRKAKICAAFLALQRLEIWEQTQKADKECEKS